jgi:hypothetical protein
MMLQGWSLRLHSFTAACVACLWGGVPFFAKRHRLKCHYYYFFNKRHCSVVCVVCDLVIFLIIEMLLAAKVAFSGNTHKIIDGLGRKKLF